MRNYKHMLDATIRHILISCCDVDYSYDVQVITASMNDRTTSIYERKYLVTLDFERDEENTYTCILEFTQDFMNRLEFSKININYIIKKIVDKSIQEIILKAEDDRNAGRIENECSITKNLWFR